MPTSPYVHIEYLCSILITFRPQSILDIGVGNGKMGYIARDVLDVTLNEKYRKEDWEIIIDGIEAFESYIQPHQRHIYNNIYIGDAYDVIDGLGIYDLVIIGDVLEHLEKEKGWLFLDKCAMHSNSYIILNIPLGETHQEAIYDNEYERHISYWYEQDFDNICAKHETFLLPNGFRYGVFLIDRTKLLYERIKQLAFKALDMDRQGDIDKAIDVFRYINTLNPNIYDSHLNMGTLLTKKGDIEGAISSFKKALELNPESHIAHYNIAKAYKDNKNYPDAVKHYIQALSINPLDPEPAYNLGNLYAELDRYDEAVVAYETALTIEPKHIKAVNNLGAVWHTLCQLDKAIDCYDRILEMDSKNVDAHYNKSLSLLLKGELKEGWRLYEWRFKREDYPPRTYPMMLWDGKTYKGNLLLYAEQGLGDTIHFIRYARLLEQRGLRVYLHCHDELVSLMKNGVSGLCDVIPFSRAYPKCDFYFPLMSLPNVFETDIDSIPSEVPYIKASDIYINKWRRILGNHADLKVGLVWAGKPEYKNERMRSVRLSTFSPLFDIDGVRFFSIQKGKASKEAEQYDSILNYSDEILDFSDTAGFIQNLDLIISVDTAVAHLAGAMAKPVWIPLPYSPDWRWLLWRDDSLWYKTAWLFRQRRFGDWSDVMISLKKHLEQLVIIKNQ